jgi:hypothetical protein
MADELDVLLEPRREAERKVVRRAARARTIRRAALAGTLSFGAIGALYVYSKRATLELASELEEARAIGAESFTKLDTCVASYKVSDREAQACREARSKERSDFRATLDRISKSGTTTQADHAREIQDLNTAYTAKLNVCEENAVNVTRACAADHERIANEHVRKEAEILAERDQQRVLAESSAGEVERCRADLLSCQKADEASRAVAVPGASARPPPVGSAPAASSAPALRAPAGSADGS